MTDFYFIVKAPIVPLRFDEQKNVSFKLSSFLQIKTTFLSMRFEFYKDYKDCSKYILGENIITEDVSFKDRFDKDSILNFILCLAAKSKGYRTDWEYGKNSGSFRGSWWLRNIDFNYLEHKINDILLFDPPFDGEFYVFIEFWGEHKFFKFTS